MRWTLVFAVLLPGLATGQSAIPVTVQSLDQLVVERQLQAPAEVFTANRAQIAAEVDAVIADIVVDVGQQVQRDQPLMVLDARDYQLALDQANANLASNQARTEQAQVRLKRAQELSDNKYIAADDLLARETDVVVLRAERQALLVAKRRAERDVAKCIINAPFDGVVTSRQAQVGSFVQRGAGLLTLVQTSASEVNAEVPAGLAATLPNAAQLDFVTDQASYPLALSRVSPVIETAQRIQPARLTFVDQVAPIGSSGQLQWSLSDDLIPSDLIVNRQQQLGVFVAEGTQARFVALPQAQEGRPVPVSLPLETQIIVGGRERLQDGASIAVTPQ